MQLTPRYDSPPIITLDGPPSGVLAPLIRQRRRLADAVQHFTDAEWSHPSRCAGWSNRDVIAHLDSVDGFWAYSVSQGVAGKPTRFLATFDPVASPAALVAASQADAPEVRDRFLASSAAFVARMEALSDDEWDSVAEAPPGHISVSALAHHALWDAWVHERDIMLPLGAPCAVEADEIECGLRYAAALGPALACSRGSTAPGTLALIGHSPALEFVVDVAAVVAVRSGRTTEADITLRGDSVELLEALSVRRPLPQSIDEKHAWLLMGLATAFDQE